eukprot:COSAG06_NODE_99_length_24156_cov_20.889549_20_plen_182_part_00
MVRQPRAGSRSSPSRSELQAVCLRAVALRLASAGLGVWGCHEGSFLFSFLFWFGLAASRLIRWAAAAGIGRAACVRPEPHFTRAASTVCEIGHSVVFSLANQASPTDMRHTVHIRSWVNDARMSRLHGRSCPCECSWPRTPPAASPPTRDHHAHHTRRQHCGGCRVHALRRGVPVSHRAGV